MSITHVLRAVLCSAIPLAAQVNVLTWHNDNLRSGANLAESILTPAVVNETTFGKLGFLPTDAKPDAQPLYVSGVPIPGQGVQNVIYVATENDTLYAASAATGAVLWQASMLKPGETPSDDRGCGQVTPIIGITSTPVIDLKAGPRGTIYLVAMSKDSTGAYHHRLHALDIATGAEEFGGPTEIAARYPGNGPTSTGGYVTFDPAQYKERAALLLLNGVVYTSWASHCDAYPYTSWVMGYDHLTLQQTSVINLTANGSEGAIWGAGAGPAASPSGEIFLLTGNGTFDTTLNSSGFPVNGDFGNALVELTPSPGLLSVTDYFTMYNTQSESGGDVDLGSGGAMVLPPIPDGSKIPHYLVVGAGKDGNLYLTHRKNLGRYHPQGDKIYQQLTGALPGGIWSAPAYFDGFIYYCPQGGQLRAFQFNPANARLGTSPSSMSSYAFSYPGAIPSVSANGAANGIVWATDGGANPAVLHAYLATDLTQELYNSAQAAGGRDNFGAGNKFVTQTVANGKLYVASQTGVAIFGILP